jgi:hypothetical protein
MKTLRLFLLLMIGSCVFPVSSLTLWQASGQLENSFDAGCGSSKNPGCGELASNPQFINGSGMFNQPDDFAIASNSPCKHAGRNGIDNIGADPDSVGIPQSQITTIFKSASNNRKAFSQTKVLSHWSISITNRTSVLISGEQVFDIQGQRLQSDRTWPDGIYISVKR